MISKTQSHKLYLDQEFWRGKMKTKINTLFHLIFLFSHPNHQSKHSLNSPILDVILKLWYNKKMLLCTFYFLKVSLPLGLPKPMDVDDDEDDRFLDLLNSSLSSLNALLKTSWSSVYRCFFSCLSSSFSFSR